MAHVWDFSVLNQRVSHMGKFFFLIIPTRPRKLELSWRRDKTVEYENSEVFRSCILIFVITVIWLTLGIVCISFNKLINLNWRRDKRWMWELGSCFIFTINISPFYRIMCRIFHHIVANFMLNQIILLYLNNLIFV